MRVVRSVLRSPVLRRVMLAFLLFNAVEYATWVAILLYAYDATGPASVGVVALIQLVPSAVFAATAAAVADRYRRDRVLLAGYVAAGDQPCPDGRRDAAGRAAASSCTSSRP